MGRRRGTPLHGWLVIDKPRDWTSTDVVRKAKGMLKPQKIGHAGTLDPLATGVLPLALGEATKTVPYLQESAKTYDFTIRWGAQTNTDDAEGTITGETGTVPEDDAIGRALAGFTGEVAQVPPAYSAVKVKGERAYDLARRGKAAELKPKTVRIYELDYLGPGEEGCGRFRMVCGTGTYVRALARDLGRALGTLGHVKTLRRTAVGPFCEKQALTLEKLQQLGHSARAQDAILPVSTALADIPALAVTRGEADRLRHGQPLKLPTKKEGRIRLECDGNLIALAHIRAGTAKPLRVFNPMKQE